MSSQEGKRVPNERTTTSSSNAEPPKTERDHANPDLPIDQDVEAAKANDDPQAGGNADQGGRPEEIANQPAATQKDEPEKAVVDKPEPPKRKIPRQLLIAQQLWGSHDNNLGDIATTGKPRGPLRVMNPDPTPTPSEGSPTEVADSKDGTVPDWAFHDPMPQGDQFRTTGPTDPRVRAAEPQYIRQALNALDNPEPITDPRAQGHHPYYEAPAYGHAPHGLPHRVEQGSSSEYRGVVRANVYPYGPAQNYSMRPAPGSRGHGSMDSVPEHDNGQTFRHYQDLPQPRRSSMDSEGGQRPFQSSSNYPVPVYPPYASRYQGSGHPHPNWRSYSHGYHRRDGMDYPQPGSFRLPQRVRPDPTTHDHAEYIAHQVRRKVHDWLESLKP